MAFQTKIATCCYCSSRTMLKPSARAGHELACGSCGAPLHEMKWLKAQAPQPKSAAKPSRAAPKPSRDAPKKYRKTKKQKRRKPIWQRGLEEAWDIIEDIFD